MKRILRSTWVNLLLGLITGLLVGALATRWHYKKLYAGYIKPKPCATINYYDKTGKILVYQQSNCTQ